MININSIFNENMLSDRINRIALIENYRRNNRENDHYDYNWRKNPLYKLSFESRDAWRIETTKISDITHGNPQETRKLAEAICFLLPNVSNSLLEIDDILYPQDDAPPNSKEDCETGEMKTHYNINIMAFSRFYPDGVEYSGNRSSDTACLKILQNFLRTAEPDHLKNYRLYFDIMGEYLFENLNNLRKLCLDLKILSICLEEKNFSDVSFPLKHWIGCHKIILISSLRQFPQSSNPDHARISSFIRTQSAVIYEKYLQNVEVKDLNVFRAYDTKKFDCDFIKDLFQMKNVWKHQPAFLFEILHKFFTTANNEDEKLERMRDFFKGLILNSNCSSDPLKCTFNVVDMIAEYFDDIIHGNKFTLDKLRHIDENCGYEIEPYMSGGVATSYVASDGGSANTSDSTKSSTELELDHVVVKHLLYDSIMKAIHVWSILYTASKMCKEMFETSRDHQHLVCNDGRLIKFILKKLRDKMMWTYKVIQKTCPFMF